MIPTLSVGVLDVSFPAPSVPSGCTCASGGRWDLWDPAARPLGVWIHSRPVKSSAGVHCAACRFQSHCGPTVYLMHSIAAPLCFVSARADCRCQGELAPVGWMCSMGQSGGGSGVEKCKGPVWGSGFMRFVSHLEAVCADRAISNISVLTGCAS